jgi:selenocysteine lyase/cysteine desulfurase
MSGRRAPERRRTMQSHKEAFRRALGADPTRLHAAAHSHHPWPDVTREAHLAAWDLAAAELDHKWNVVFGDVLPRARAHVARVLRLDDPATVVFAPNTHEFVARLVSNLPLGTQGRASGRPLRVLSTGSEFHSFTRQAARWVEAGLVEWERVETQPFDTLAKRFAAAAARGHDLVYTSHVFYDSAYVFEEAPALLAALPDSTVAVLDGYHGFMAVDTDLSAVAARVFYVSGGYKYAMSGEGACFMHCPPGRIERPVDTGWFAGFDALERTDGRVGYGTDGSRFFGATFDVAGLFRMVAVVDWLQGAGLDVRVIHARVAELFEHFLDHVAAGRAGDLTLDSLLPPRGSTRRGNFLCFVRPDATDFCHRLAEQNTIVDARGDRLRIGFGLYHDHADVDALAAACARVSRSAPARR